MLKIVDKETLLKIWDNIVKWLTCTLPEEDTVKIILHQRGNFEHDPTKFIIIESASVEELSGQWLAERIEKKNNMNGWLQIKSKCEQIKFLDMWFCLSFIHEKKIVMGQND